MECRLGLRDQSGFDVGRPDHLGPLLGFVGDELAEFGGRAGKHVPPRSAIRAFILGSARPALISLFSFSMISAGVFLGAPTPNQCARLVARHELSNGRDVRQRFRARRGRHRQRAQLASPDVLDRRGQLSNMTCTCPPSRSVSAGAAPR